MTRDALFSAVAAEMRRVLEHAPGCHDCAHTMRVLANTERLAEMEHVSPDTLFAARLAALLHDIARPEEFASGGGLCHAELGASKAERILRSAGAGEEALIGEVSNAVRRHRFRGGAKPETMVDKLVYDADKLDSIGAVGIGRAFHFAGRVGAKLHNSEREALGSAPYSAEDTAYREYLVKLRHVPGRMLTRSGRELAVERAAYMDGFFRRMNENM